jgi:coenzyme F420-0:L-glutamate ligase/coenzyme F420-1:gamma-L-glutamate ligase
MPDDAPREPISQVGPRVELTAIPGLPVVDPGDDLPGLVISALERADLELRACDVLVVASKLVSRAEGRFVDASTVTPSERARRLAREVDKDPRLVQVILEDSQAVSRRAPDVLIVRHRLGLVSANAAIDQSNATPPYAPPGGGPWLLRLPAAPDTSAEGLRQALERRYEERPIGVVVSDSLGRPFRLGTVGHAIGLSGLPALFDMRGEADLFGRRLEHTVTALADQVAAAADLVMGQAAEGRGAVRVRGLRFEPSADGADALQRPVERDLYA